MENKRGKYKTKQRELILSFLIEGAERHITADTITEGLKGKAGQATVYRNLEELANEGIVLKYEAPFAASGACYRYIGEHGAKEGFYHFLCTCCGQMLHLNCEMLNNLSAHVEKDHGLSLSRQKTVLYGACGRCGGGQEKQEEMEAKGECKCCEKK